jgi:hypothetical protein
MLFAPAPFLPARRYHLVCLVLPFSKARTTWKKELLRVGLRFLTSGGRGGSNQGRRFPPRGCIEVWSLSVGQGDTSSGNMVEKAHTKRSEKAKSGSEGI